MGDTMDDIRVYCGLDYEKCPVFIATLRNDDDLRRETAKEWSALFTEYIGREVKAEDIHCTGCWAESGVFIGCVNCVIRNCCRKRGLETCAYCDEYEQCNMIKGFLSNPDYQQVKDTLEKMRKKESAG